MRKIFPILFMALSLSLFVGCNNNADNKTEDNAMYHKITAAEAKSMMEENTNYILLDVRTKSEFDDEHIEGAILLPNDQIAEKIEEVIPDKNQIILIYCRSGNRSAQAAKVMVSMGYTNVYDFGGIIDWPYETVE